MAKKKVTKKKTVKKKSDKLYFNCFTMNPTKNGFRLNPKLDEKYGVASIVITHHDGTEWELDDDSVLWCNEVEGYDFYAVSGSIEPE